MKLVDAEYTFDESKLLFYFTADGRVDFRDLVKDLAAIFRLRIELRQIGVRDEAKMIGGLGSCGRALCCATFLGDFAPVSIKMAKEQNLSLNPTKISGICGRLMCCLRYESDVYKERRAVLGESGCGCTGDCCHQPSFFDEFYHEIEDQDDFYADLLKEDTIQEVDYEMMREAAEAESHPVISDDEDEVFVEEQPQPKKESRKETRKGGCARAQLDVRRIRYEQQPEKQQSEKKQSEGQRSQAAAKENPEGKPKSKRPRRRRRRPNGNGAAKQEESSKGGVD